jgi:glutaredoxin
MKQIALKVAVQRCGLVALTSALCLFGQTAQAQLYKWVGPDGKVTYSDTPPPAGAKQLNTKAANSGGGSSAPLPADVAAAVARNPVVLYTAPNCNPCNLGSALLKKRGVPFSEKTITSYEDGEKLKQISGQSQLPFLTISNTKISGFNDAEWELALSSAGYPESNKLPKDFKYADAEPAVPLPPPVVKQEPEKRVVPPPKPKPVPDSGIRF